MKVDQLIKVVQIGRQYDLFIDLDLTFFDPGSKLVEIVDNITCRGSRYDGNRIVVLLVFDDLNLAASVRDDFEIRCLGRIDSLRPGKSLGAAILRPNRRVMKSV
jgi:hypothetical protein